MTDVKTTVAAYCDVLSATNTYTQGWIRTKGIKTSSECDGFDAIRSVRDLDNDTSKSYIEHYSSGCKQTTLSYEMNKPIAMDISPSGKYVITLKLGKDDIPLVDVRINVIDGSDERDDNTADGSSFIVNADDRHGKFINDGWFSDITWSHTERYFAYVANPKEAKRSTYINGITDAITATTESSSSSISSSSSSSSSNNDECSKFEYKEDWGEKYEGIQSTVIVVCDIQTQTVRVLSGVNSDYTVGQPVFLSSNQLAYTAWSFTSRRLGMIYCYQRPCSIYLSSDVTSLFDTDVAASIAANKPSLMHTLLSDDFLLARTPRYCPSGNAIIFLGNKKGFQSHNGTFGLYRINLSGNTETKQYTAATTIAAASTSAIDTIIDVVAKPSEAEAFPGIYGNLSRGTFVTPTNVVFASSCGSVERVYDVDTTTNKVTTLSDKIVAMLKADSRVVSIATGVDGDAWNRIDDYSFAILDTKCGYILLSLSSPSQPSFFCLYDYKTNTFTTNYSKYIKQPYSIKFKHNRSIQDTATTSISITDALACLRWKVLKFVEDGIPFEAILILPSSVITAEKKPSLIVVPHGGPHSVMPTSFIPGYAYLVTHLKTAVLHVNFRGSIGFGQDSIDSLLGKIGCNDVNDLLTATNHVIAGGYVNRDSIGIVGGSHGGFLGAHMIGQYPDIFKVSALRNPVINIPGMAGSTDIPDWCSIEALGKDKYNFNTSYNIITDKDLVQMRMVSPIHYIHNVTAPTLICLGLKDRRVPPSQGIEFYHQLKAKKVPAKLMTFPEDVHAIDKPSSEADQWISIALWLQQYL